MTDIEKLSRDATAAAPSAPREAEELSEAERIAAEAYQVIGALAVATDTFETDEVIRALDYFSGDNLDGSILPYIPPARAVQRDERAPAASENANHTAWLIEWPAGPHDPVRYWRAHHAPPVIDPHEATRFSRRHDAEAVEKYLKLLGARVAEHVFGLAFAFAAPVQADGLEPTRRLYLDLDGVMADFDAHFPAVFGLDHRSMADEAMWATINAHPSYFRDMPPCPGAIEFFRSIEHLRPIILTACPRTNYANAAKQKRAWVREHLSRHVTVLPVMGGRNKPLFMQEPGDILIDDWSKNTDAWTEAGGVAILHTDFDVTGEQLWAILAAPPSAQAGERP